MTDELTSEQVREIARREGTWEPGEELARALARFALRREGQLERVQALLARWEDEAGRLREPYILRDESGELWLAGDHHTEYVMLTAHARELRAVLDHD